MNNRYYRAFPIFGLIFITIPIGISLMQSFLGFIWLILSILSGAMAMNIAHKKRPCGHGSITQGKLGIYWPFVIKRCPICGAEPEL